MKTCLEQLKKEAVLLCSALLALSSMIWVPPDRAYAAYLDVRVLVLLFCLMAVVGSAKEQGVFVRLCEILLRRTGNLRTAALVLVLLPFFCAMLITNDVALITFVPLAIAALREQPRAMLLVVVMQTIAANLGSALTPVGNPQNLYLAGYYGLPILTFVRLTAPIVAAGLALTTASTLLFVSPDRIAPCAAAARAPLSKPKLFTTAALFLLCVACVLHLVSYRLVLGIVCAALLPNQRRAFHHVDVSLLLTFVCLFVFVGNLARMDAVRSALCACIGGRALPVAALSSQLISNVPAALMLSGFTADGAGLVLGTNIGGLGTPIASMASLISLRLFSKTGRTAQYLVTFSCFNFLFLTLLLALERLLGNW
ncbi:MAG: SLC13 family permease [Oscillospiraceae bacterium]|nr:SLC13 family permease [Oscillospiraceae bacterium]